MFICNSSADVAAFKGRTAEPRKGSADAWCIPCQGGACGSSSAAGQVWQPEGIWAAWPHGIKCKQILQNMLGRLTVCYSLHVSIDYATCPQCTCLIGWSESFPTCCWCIKKQGPEYGRDQQNVLDEPQRCSGVGDVSWSTTWAKPSIRLGLWPFQVCKQSYTRHVQYVKLLITLLLKYCLLCFRSTPIEVLHTVLLGPYKYLTGKVMAKLNTMEKHEVLARIASINHSGIEERISSNVTRYSQSVGISRLGLKWLPSSCCHTWQQMSLSCGWVFPRYVCILIPYMCEHCKG